MSAWPKHQTDLKFKKRLGRGYFGEVWSATWNSLQGEQIFAVKKIPLAIVKQHKLTDQLEREIEILKSLKHPYIVESYFDFRDVKFVYLGMHFAAGGGMFDKLSKCGKFTIPHAAQYFYEMVDALDYMHSRNPPVIHRDIKPENILFNKEGHVQLADFGWSNVMTDAGLRSTFCGTPDYLAPEMIRGDGHDQSLDMWEMGVLLYEMTIGKSPFGASSQEQTCKLILKLDLRFPSTGDADAQDLICKLCKLKPKERLTAKQSKQHHFVTKNFGAPTCDAMDVPDEPRPSVESRKLLQETNLLQRDMENIMQAKEMLDGQLALHSGEHEAMLKVLQKEQRIHDEAKCEYARLKDREMNQIKELDDLRLRIDSVSPDVQRSMRRGG